MKNNLTPSKILGIHPVYVCVSLKLITKGIGGIRQAFNWKTGALREEVQLFVQQRYKYSLVLLLLVKAHAGGSHKYGHMNIGF